MILLWCTGIACWLEAPRHDLSFSVAIGCWLGAPVAQGMILLLPRGAKVAAYLGTGLGCWIGAPRYDWLGVPKYDLALALALAAALGRQGLIFGGGLACCLRAPRMALDWAAASGCQGGILPRHWNWLLSRGAKVGSHLGAGIGCCLGAPRYDLTLVLALAVAFSSTASCTGLAF